MEGNCAGNSGRSWAEDDFPELLLPRFLREMLGEDLYEHKGEHSCELCHQNIHSEPTEWVTCKASTLSVSDTGTTVSDAKDMQCFLNADEGPEIRKSVRCVKKEQVRDLLSAESTIFKNTRWQVLFSDNFQKSFQKLRFFSTKKLVINLLLNLARGWRPRKANVDWKCENSSYILKQLKVDIYYVVCSVDIVKDSIYKQVLKVWDILPMTDTTKLLKRIDSIASSYTDEFINHCNEKLFERNLEVPLSWSLSTDIPRFKNTSNSKLVSVASTSSIECNTYVENSKVSESMLLMKFYSMSSGTVTHLLWDSEDNIVDLPFEVTDKEREIINFPRSSFILGRSGTGKTTILTLKLYQKFQMYSLVSRDSVVADDGVSISDEVDAKQCHGGSKGPVLHQLFVTVSSKLCDAVKKNVAQMKSIATDNLSNENNFTVMDDVDDASEFKDIPDTFVGIQQERYPLIITFHKFLMMLDGTLGKSYFERFPSVRDSSHSRGQRSVTLETFFRKNEVNYDRFSFIYWPHFNAKLTKSLDASRVFTEIISHIKGGPTEGEACSYKRSRQDYTSLSESRTSTLCVEQRDAIYDIFEDYEKMKIERGDFDLADFVSDIHLRLDKEDFPGGKMDFVYIDEVQDLTMRQIFLFRYMCNNVDEGFVFSGDTAQTIARGIDFKFEDIRSLFYNEFLMRPRNCDLSGKKEKGVISAMFNLSYNFRTHTGVLNLAQSVVDLLCYYFPHSIDVLAPETSQISGESPIVLEPGNDENLIVSIFGHSKKCGRKWVGFGADQVILVRDDSVKKEVSNYIGHQALILSIVECKGLEFEAFRRLVLMKML